MQILFGALRLILRRNGSFAILLITSASRASVHLEKFSYVMEAASSVQVTKQSQRMVKSAIKSLVNAERSFSNLEYASLVTTIL